MSDKIIDHLERYTLIRDSQLGFVKRKSCLTNLLIFMQKVTNYLDSSYPVDVIGLYLDFQKAFDKVPHKRLLMKLQAHRIDGELLRCIKERLSGRRQSCNLWTIFQLDRCFKWGSTGISLGTRAVCHIYQ